MCPHCGSDLLLRERYRVLQPLGSGGFGRTFEAEDNGELKVLKVLYKNHPKAVTLFQQEAKVLSRLSHPGIPKVPADGYFVFWPKDSKEPVHCLVMEKIEGLNLMEWLRGRNHEPIDQDQAIAWLQQLVDILDQVHQQHYFHRDIKPHNIMRRPDGQLVLIDFGTAREVTGTYLNKVGGGQNVTEIISAGYTPPEQINGKAVPQSDFYALGRTFVYLLTGKRPTEFLEHPRTGKLLWREGAPQVSCGLADVIDYMMAPFPGNRPQHAQMILLSLAEVEPTLTASKSSGHWSLGRTATGSPLTGGSYRRTDISGIPSANSGLGTSGLRSGVSGLRSSTSKLRSTSWLDQLQDWIQNSPLQPVLPFLASGLLIGLVTTQAYGYFRYNAFPANPIKVIANIPSNWFLQRTLKTKGEVLSIALTPDGKTLASGSYGTIRLWKVETGEQSERIAAHNSWIEALAMSPDGKVLASGSNDQTIRLWMVDRGVRRLTLGGDTGTIHALAFSPDGKILASGSADQIVRLWDTTNGARILTLTGHRGGINALAIDPTGRILASGSDDQTIRLWDLDSGRLRSTLTSHAGSVQALAISPDGKTLASASSDNTVILWNLETGERQHTLFGHQSWVRAVAFSPDGKTLASAGDTLELWQPETGEHQRTLRGHDSWIESIAISADSQTLVSGGHDRTMKVWRLP